MLMLIAIFVNFSAWIFVKIQTPQSHLLLLLVIAQVGLLLVYVWKNRTRTANILAYLIVGVMLFWDRLF